MLIFQGVITSPWLSDFKNWNLRGVVEPWLFACAGAAALKKDDPGDGSTDSDAKVPGISETGF